MTVSHLGSVTLGAAVPAALAAQGSIDLAVGVSLPEIQAKLAGLLAANLVPPTLAASLTTALQVVAGIQAAITLGLPPIDFQAAAIAEVIVLLQDQLALLQAQASFSIALGTTLGASGIHLCKYEGEVGQFGTQLQQECSDGFPGGSASDETLALILAGTTPEAIAALIAMFKTD